MFEFNGTVSIDNQKYVPKGSGLLVIKVDNIYKNHVKAGLVQIKKEGGRKHLSFNGDSPFYQKTDKQNRFFWSIYDLLAKCQNANQLGENPVTGQVLFEADVKSFGEKLFPFNYPKKEIYLLRNEFYIFDDETKDIGSGMVFVHCYKRFSHYSKKQAMEWIDVLLQRLGEMDVPKELGPVALKKWHDFQLMANNEKWIRKEGEKITQAEYKKSVSICEMCGRSIHEDGSLAHIVARGMGGNQEDWKESPENWLHLHDTCHYYLDNGPGLKKVLEENPHLKNKIESAHKLGAKGNE